MAEAGKNANQLFSISKMVFMESCIRAEMDSQLRFGQEWSKLLGPEHPKTLEEAIAAKKRELQELQVKAGFSTAADVTYTSTVHAGFNSTAKGPLGSPERGFHNTLGTGTLLREKPPTSATLKATQSQTIRK